MDTETIGSAGTLVAAGLSTAGHYLQSRILDFMQAGLVNRLGYFFFLLAAAGCLVRYALTGRAKEVMWLLLSPSLVFMLLFVRIESGGTAWQRGEKIFDRQHVQDSIAGIYAPKVGVSTGSPLTSKPINVSFFFAKWDNIVSGISQSVVRFLSLIDPKSDDLFLTRTERFMELFHSGIPDPDVARFYNEVLYPKCLDWISVKQAIANPAEVIDDAFLQTRLNELGNRIVIGASDPANELLNTLHGRGSFGSAGEKSFNGYACPALWKLGVQSARLLASGVVAEKVGASLPQDLAADTMLKEIAVKFGTNSEFEIQDQNHMMNAVAARMLQRSLRSSVANLADEEFGRYTNAPVGSLGPYAESAQNAAASFQIYGKYLEYRGRGEYLTYMLGLPYVQGIGYFFLALSYPFFVLFMIFPSRMGSILVWIQLWAWLKAWDFGFAVVTVLDNLLFYLLPTGPAMTDDMLNDPGMAFKAVLSSDPTYTSDLYYNIVATSLAAVPIFTGLLVRRGGREFMSLMVSGTNTFAGRLGDSLSSFAASWHGQRILGESEREKVQMAMAARDTLLDDTETRRAATAAGLGSVFGGAAGGMPGAMATGLSGETKRYGMQWLQKRATAVSAYAAFKNSVSETQIRRGQDLAGAGFVLHDLTEVFPTSEIMELMAARVDYRYGNAANSMLREGARRAAHGGAQAALGIGSSLGIDAVVRGVGERGDDEYVPTPIDPGIVRRPF